jgi:hypothetical protein
VLNDFFGYTTEELCSIATQYATRKEPIELLPIPSSREATTGSSNVMPSDAAVRDAKRESKGGKKRRKQCRQRVTIMVDDDNDKKANDSGMGCIATTMHSGKGQA